MHILGIHFQGVIIVLQGLFKLAQLRITVPEIIWLRSIVEGLDISTWELHFLGVAVDRLLEVVVFAVEQSEIGEDHWVGGVQLDGPFEVVDGLLNTNSLSNYLFIWRLRHPLLWM